MKRLFLLVLLIGLLSGLTSRAEIVRKYRSKTDSVFCFKVDSIDYRKDLTRVYGSCIGLPNTSQRIDNVRLISGETSANATDIDGVDFKRYFQWEEDGLILLEIDFPAMKSAKSLRLVFDTVHGSAVTDAKL